MHGSVLAWFTFAALTPDEVSGRDVLEVGSGDVNGSVRPILEKHRPRSYLGVDAGEGPRVDRVVDAAALTAELGADCADIVISTEMMEHVTDWQACVTEMAAAVRPGGLLLVTTRGEGFPYHPHPVDTWRYSAEAFTEILARLGFTDVQVIPDPEWPGIFARARKPEGWQRPDAVPAVLLAGISGVTPMRPPLSFLGIPFGPDGSGYYRFYLPYKHLAANSPHRVMMPPPGAPEWYPNDDQLEEIDVIAGQRMCGGTGIKIWEHYKGKTALVYETDDDILHPDPSGLPHMFDPKVRESFTRCIALSDLVTVSTEPLAGVMRQYNPNVRVLPNHINDELLALERPRRDRLTVGWSGGASHLADWAAAGSAVSEALAAHPAADMHFIGADYSPLLGRECRFDRWQVSVWDYYKTVDFDIGLAPLAPLPFNDSKSHIRALEYAALGIPVIASDLPPYRDFVIDGVTGYLVRTQQQWQQRLTELINDEAARAEMGAKAREAAAAFTIQSGWRLWNAAYEEVAGRGTQTADDGG